MAVRSPYAAQIAKNTTRYPSFYPGGTYRPALAPQTPVYSAVEPQAQQQQAPVAQALTQNPFETDPSFLAALANEQAGTQQLDAALRAAQEQAIVRFGDPGLAQAAGLALDPLTAAMAQQNTQSGNSTLAQLQRTRDQNQMALQNNLAAHGIINSGDLGYRTGQNQRNYGTSLYNTQQDLLAGLAGLASDTAAQKRGLRSSTTSALTDAYDRYVANPQFWGAAGVNDGGKQSAANTVATGGGYATPSPLSSPVATSLSGRRPASRLASPSVSPYAGQVARNMRFG